MSPRHLAALLVLPFVLLACGGGGQPSSVTWLGSEVHLPDGWHLFEQEEDRLSIANADIGMGEVRGAPNEAEADGGREDLPDDVVAMFFTYEPNTTPADWRDFVDAQDAVLETDDRLVLDEDVPATRLIFRYETNGIPMREMVVLVPSRGIVLLAQPIPGPGDTDAPEVFLDHVDTFLEVVDSLELGPPPMES